MTRYVHAFHKTDAAGVDQSIGVDGHGQIWLAAGLTDASAQGATYAQFEPEDALSFAAELAKLARAGIRVRMRQASYSSADGPDPT